MAPAESERINTCGGVAVTGTWAVDCEGSDANAHPSTVMWSAVVLLPALPARSSPASASPPAMSGRSKNTSSGWNPKVFLFSALDEADIGCSWARSVQRDLAGEGASSGVAEGRQAERDGAAVVGDLIELVEFLAGGVEADLEAVDFTEPSLAAGFGDASDAGCRGSRRAVPLGRVGSQEGAAQAGVFVDQGVA